MAARIALFVSLVLTVIALIFFNLPKKEKVVYQVPPGYQKASAIEVVRSAPDEIPSALAYAQAFEAAPEAPALQEAPIIKKKLKKITVTKKFVKNARRHLARTKGKKNLLLARR